MTWRLILIAAVTLTLSGCDKLTPQKTDSSAAASDAASSFVPPTRIDEVMSADDLKAEAEVMADHPGHAKRQNFLLTLFNGGQPIASFENRFDCPGWCGQWSYDGAYQLVDPATDKPVDYDKVTISYDEDSDDYLVDHDGHIYYLGFDSDLTLFSPSKLYVATTDQNLNGDGRISLFDTKQKTTFQVLSSKSVKGATNNCTPLAWTGRDRLRALCSLRPDSDVYSGIEIARQPDGRWRVTEQETFPTTEVELDERVGNDVLKLKAGAKGSPAKDAAVFYAEAMKDVSAKLPGYKRLAGN